MNQTQSIKNPTSFDHSTPQFPVIYTLEPIGADGASEATGTHWYCSIECRKEGNPIDGDRAIDWDGPFSYGMSELDADGLHCETCNCVIEPPKPTLQTLIADFMKSRRAELTEQYKRDPLYQSVAIREHDATSAKLGKILLDAEAS